MKNIIFVLLLLTSLLFTSCYAKVVVLQEAPKPEPEVVVVEKVITAAEGDLKTGLSFITTTQSSSDGNVQAESTLVAVTVDKNGIIQDCIIDMVQAPITFDANGQLTSDLNAQIQSKNELGDKYGMKVASSIGKEWDEQMRSLANYVVGKTVEDIQGISFKNGKVDDVDLASSVTVYIGGFLNSIIDAVNNAEYRGAQAGDKLALVTSSDIASSKSATDAESGLAQADINAAVVTSKDGIITSCYIDAVQVKVNFDNNGKITSTLSSDVETKNELNTRYGMGKYSSIGKDWHEQIASFSSYVTGKSIEEVNGISVNEKTAPTDADLSSSVTMSIGGFKALLNKAF